MGKKCKKHTSEEQRRCPHTRQLNIAMSCAINEGTRISVLTSNQAKDQSRGYMKHCRHKTVPIPTYLSFLMCSVINEMRIQLVDECSLTGEKIQLKGG